MYHLGRMLVQEILVGHIDARSGAHKRVDVGSPLVYALRVTE